MADKEYQRLRDVMARHMPLDRAEKLAASDLARRTTKPSVSRVANALSRINATPVPGPLPPATTTIIGRRG